ncbi:hypothetical protein FQN54_009660 [Arachnomyces sp. PD_36]|nr:hypothetical protein FQN54_009660 [Arachnomyces sp. PD_36]
MITSALIVSLAALAAASPVEPNRRSKLVERQSFSDDKDAFCNAPSSTPEEAQTLWIGSDAWITLDDYVSFYTDPGSDEPEPDDWLRKMVQEYFPYAGDEGVDGCANIDVEGCEPAEDLECGIWWDEHENVFDRSIYWILVAAEKTHAKFRSFRDTVRGETLLTSMEIGEMIKVFGGDESTDSSDFTYLSAAFSMINGVTGAIPGAQAIAAGAGVLGGMFSAAAESAADEGVEISTISAALAEISRRTEDVIASTLRTAMGKAEDPADYDTLPVPSWDTLHTRIGKFFNGGYWLLDDDSQAAFDSLEIVRTAIRSITADLILRNSGFMLAADKRATSGEDCGYGTGRQWMNLKDDEWYCFYLLESTDTGYYEAKEEVYEALADYGLGEREYYYRAILDCALSDNENKKPDLSNLPIGGVAECMFSVPAKWYDYGNDPIACDPYSLEPCVDYDTWPIE